MEVNKKQKFDKFKKGIQSLGITQWLFRSPWIWFNLRINHWVGLRIFSPMKPRCAVLLCLGSRKCLFCPYNPWTSGWYRLILSHSSRLGWAHCLQSRYRWRWQVNTDGRASLEIENLGYSTRSSNSCRSISERHRVECRLRSNWSVLQDCCLQ